MAAELAVVAGDRFNKLVLNAPAGLNDPAYPATDMAMIAPQDFPGYLAHHMDVGLRCFPGGAECLPPEDFGAARQRSKGAAKYPESVWFWPRQPWPLDWPYPQ